MAYLLQFGLGEGDAQAAVAREARRDPALMQLTSQLHRLRVVAGAVGPDAPGALGSVALAGGGVGFGCAAEEEAAVASAGSGGDLARFQHDRAQSRARKPERERDARDPRADDGDIGGDPLAQRMRIRRASLSLPVGNAPHCPAFHTRSTHELIVPLPYE